MASYWWENNKPFSENKYWFMKWIDDEKPKKITLLLTGKTGVGKSRLVNSLIGSKVAKEGRAKNWCTKTVNCYQTIKAGVEIVVWDSPGLQDGTECEREYIQDMSTKIKEVDLVIYCLKMDDTRLRDEDLKAMGILTEVFGKNLWENAVLALTFADKVQDPDDNSPARLKKYFIEELKNWEAAFRDRLSSEGIIDVSTIDNIPKIPTGLVKKLTLPDRDNWLTEFWVHCYEKMKVGCGVNLLNVNKQRMNFPNKQNFNQLLSESFDSGPSYSPSPSNQKSEPSIQNTPQRDSPSRSIQRTGASAYNTRRYSQPRSVKRTETSTDSAQARYSATFSSESSESSGEISPARNSPPSSHTVKNYITISSETALPIFVSNSSGNISISAAGNDIYSIFTHEEPAPLAVPADLAFNPDQAERVKLSTWRSFTSWVADKLEEDKIGGKLLFESFRQYFFG